MEINTNFKINSACDEHEKFFFILHQGSLDKSFLWDNNKIFIKHYSDKVSFSIENDSRSFINHTKMFLFFYDSLNRILSQDLNDKFYVSKDYEILKINDDINFSIDHQDALIYLPQTNQMLRHGEDILDRKIFLTHTYVVIIPISLSPQLESNQRRTD